MSDFETHTIAAATHGRYLVRRGPAERLLIGFHGYAQNAEQHLSDLVQIPGIEQWTVVAVQALNRFYAPRSQPPGTVASWMTSQDRELVIADNIAYVRAVLTALPPPKVLVFLGFSQGASMAYRAAAAVRATSALIALGGDVPPDVSGLRMPVLIGRGTGDDWYTEERLRKDVATLEPAAAVVTHVFDGGHEWTASFRDAASAFLSRL